MQGLTETRRILLQAISDLQPDAYGATLNERTGLSIARIYSELEAMEADYLVGHRDVPGGSERGGRVKRLWSLTRVGRTALDPRE